MEKVSTDGVITVEESKTAETYSEVVEGMQFDRGYITPVYVHRHREDGSKPGRRSGAHHRQEAVQHSGAAADPRAGC